MLIFSRKLILFMMASFFSLSYSGCSGYPLDLKQDEWNSLTPEERTQALARQAQLDRLDRVDQRCQRDSERVIHVNTPVVDNAGIVRNNKFNITIGLDLNLYNECMKEAGYKQEVNSWNIPLLEVDRGASPVQ